MTGCDNFCERAEFQVYFKLQKLSPHDCGVGSEMSVLRRALLGAAGFDFQFVCGASLSSGKARGENAVGRAGNVSESYSVAELH